MEVENSFLKTEPASHLGGFFREGSAHGSNIAKSFVLQKPMPLTTGVNNISLLGATFGFPVINNSPLLHSPVFQFSTVNDCKRGIDRHLHDV